MAVEKPMTIAQIADILELSYVTIYNSAKALFPNKIKNGVKTYFNELEVTAIKANLSKNLKVAVQPKTRLEEDLLIFQALNTLQERILALQEKADLLDKITASITDISLRDLASILAVPYFNQYHIKHRMKNDGYLDKDGHPLEGHIDSGLMYEKIRYVPCLEISELELRITQKGLVHFVKLYGEKQPQKIAGGEGKRGKKALPASPQ